jgi:DNA repair exonuclease SbcCD nuclease subunit
VLHADLDVTESRHAPVTRSELAAERPDAWLLGHVHLPSEFDASRPIGYLGSLVGLDPTETGVHGPSLVELGPGRGISVHRLPLAPLRWHAETIDASEWPGDEELEVAVGRALSRVLDALPGDDASAPRAVGVRIRVEGRTDHGAALRARAQGMRSRLEEYSLTRGDRIAAVESIDVRTSPRIDLAELARGHDPLAHVASAVLALERGPEDPRCAELVEAGLRDLRVEASRDPWKDLDDVVLDEEAVRRRLVDAGHEVVETLLARESREEA